MYDKVKVEYLAVTWRMCPTKILTRFTHNCVLKRKCTLQSLSGDVVCRLFSVKQREKYQNFQKSEHSICKEEFLTEEKRIPKIKFQEHLILENEPPSLSTHTHHKI